MAKQAVEPGDRAYPYRDRAVARRGRLPRRARLGRVEGRRTRVRRGRRRGARAPQPGARDRSRSRGGARLQGPDRRVAARRRRRRAVPPRARDRSRSESRRGARDDRIAVAGAAASCAGWERVLKRVLFRLRGRGNVAEAKAWARLSRLYFDHLDDPEAGAAAASNARKIAPRDSDVAALITRTEGERQRRTHPRADPRGVARGARQIRSRAPHSCAVPSRVVTPTPRSSRRRRWSRSARRTPRWPRSTRSIACAASALPDAAARPRAVGAAPPQGRQHRARCADGARRAGRARARSDDARATPISTPASASTRPRCPRRSRSCAPSCAGLLGVHVAPVYRARRARRRRST